MGKKEKDILGTSALVWLTVGNMVGSGIMVLTGAAAAKTGYSVWLAFIIATVLGFLGSWPQILAAGTSVLDGGMFSHKFIPFSQVTLINISANSLSRNLATPL